MLGKRSGLLSGIFIPATKNIIKMNPAPRTIAALSTPAAGRGALAVIRLSGNDAHRVFTSVIREQNKFGNASARKIALYAVVGSAEIIDEVTAVKYCAPQSFTGEDMVEIFCHGGTIIPVKILDALFSAGAVAACKGEFSRRALINGKVDMLKAESIAELIESQTEKRLASAQLAYQGKQFEALEKIKLRIVNVLSDLESGIEFAEEDDVAKTQTERVAANKRELESIIFTIEEDLRRGDAVKSLDAGIVVALAGPPNAGKSSLFNEILGYDRSIVHDLPGTTRDAVSETVSVGGVTVKLFDCAGLRETSDAVERRGIERTLSAVKDASVVIWVTAADTPFEDGERDGILSAVDECGARAASAGKKLLAVINKIDLGAVAECKKRFFDDHSIEYVETSLTEKTNADVLFAAIMSSARCVSENAPPPEMIMNGRHRRIALAMLESLRACVSRFDAEEVAAYYLKAALDFMSEFLGFTASDDVLNEVFEKFCIGK